MFEGLWMPLNARQPLADVDVLCLVHTLCLLCKTLPVNLALEWVGVLFWLHKLS